MPQPIKATLLAALLAACTQRAQAPPNPRVEAFAKLPDWSGLWEPNAFVGEGIGQGLTDEGRRNALALISATVPFNAEWQTKFDAAKQAQQAAVAADPDHPPALTTRPRCSMRARRSR